MKLADIPLIRLYNQQISHKNSQTPQQVVSSLGVLQAQDYEMSKWAIGTRLSGLTDRKTENALDSGKILRTHLLRPTWHLVAAEDIYWLLELSAPHILASQKWRHKQLELDDTSIRKSRKIIEHAFRSSKQVSRETLVKNFEDAGFILNDNRASHLLFLAELEGIICSGVTRGKKTTYALLSERAPATKPIPREEALSRLALLYFSSRGPATLADFGNWSGLGSKDITAAMASLASHIISEKIDDQEYWFEHKITLSKKESLFLLPAFDEYLIAYKDRTAVLEKEHHKKAVSNNGIFWPTIVHNGLVTGLWKRSIQKNTLKVDATLFAPFTPHTQDLIEKAAQIYAAFEEKEVKVTVSHKQSLT